MLKRLVEHADSEAGREKDRREELDKEEQRQQEEASKVQINEDVGTGKPVFVDPRSPLERFRKAPRKNLSVTDLVSPAWCELQYWYSLTKFGRKRPTPAMKQGTAVHKTLEEQVHTTVEVQVSTREDGWALRLWNIIQGLHTLRTTGMTRELEVWGVIDGEMVTGIIDELSYNCPDPELEASTNPECPEVRSAVTLTPEDCMSISDYLLSASGGGKTLSDYAASMPDWANWTSSTSPSTKERRIYLTDVKTRGVSTKPPSASSIGFRPTLLQLHLYYHMLTRMATSDDVTMEFIAARHRLKPERPFSDGLIAQVGSLDNQFLNIESSPTSNSDSEDALNVLLQHNSLSKLWALMKEHMRLTFLPSSQFPEASSTHGHPQSVESNIEKPNTVSPPTILSPLLTATYVSSHTDPSDPTHYLGSRSFYFDANDLYPYLADGMRFWRGRRSAKGVGMVEAWKCVICEFRDECEWRAAREKEASLRGSRKVRKKKSSGGKKSEDEGEKD